MKFKTFGIVITLIVLLTMASIAIRTCNRLCEIEDGINQNIGRDVVIRGDTLTVVDFNVWNNSYVLSNGTQVSAQIITKP